MSSSYVVSCHPYVSRKSHKTCNSVHIWLDYDVIVFFSVVCLQVFLVRKISGKDTGQVFAMKVLKKVVISLF